MKVSIEKKVNPNIEKYHREDLDLASKFTQEIHKELGQFIKAVVIFGSAARKTETDGSDIDLLIVIDDLSMNMNQELVEAYRIIVQKLIVKVSPRLHITSLRFTAFWEYIRNGDPVGVNILRDGLALIDTGFFDPLQVLLRKGKIRPTPESVWTYFMRAPNTLHNSKWHILQATLDLYWAVIDSAHAALMKLGEIPPSPNHVSDLMEEKMVKKKLLEHKYVGTMRNFYKLSKMIGHRQISEIKGQEYDKYFLEAQDFVHRMRKFIDA
ncbi:MAG: nucleotidyltransferase domain-containing protein [Nanoarchaeota archaeon]